MIDVKKQITFNLFRLLKTPYILFLISGLFIGNVYIFLLKMNPIYMLLLPILIFGLAISAKSEIGIILILIFTYLITNWFSSYFTILPRSFLWISDIIIFILLTKVIIFSSVGKKSFQRTPIELPLLLFLFIGILSWLVNNVPASIAIIGGFRKAFIYILLFL